MGTFGSLSEAQEYFTGDRFATESGMVIRGLGEDYAETAMTLTEHHKNANGGVMGGVIFTLADFAFAVCVNQIHKPTVAQQVSINYLGAPKGKQLFAKAVCRKNGRTSTIVNVDVTDETGRDVAQFTGTGFKL
ncbi:MAG: PaaI family thioesterase [Lachnospiraceae bacterium]|nr:PaaI family thioesterase [Lachnospiraceae bacterium]MCR5086124.1 PaaI family thioesterase [Lachnospiraceae bacterium]